MTTGQLYRLLPDRGESFRKVTEETIISSPPLSGVVMEFKKNCVRGGGLIFKTISRGNQEGSVNGMRMRCFHFDFLTLL